jgi:hypothetical protein
VRSDRRRFDAICTAMLIKVFLDKEPVILSMRNEFPSLPRTRRRPCANLWSLPLDEFREILSHTIYYFF